MFWWIKGEKSFLRSKMCEIYEKNIYVGHTFLWKYNYIPSDLQTSFYQKICTFLKINNKLGTKGFSIATALKNPFQYYKQKKHLWILSTVFPQKNIFWATNPVITTRAYLLFKFSHFHIIKSPQTKYPDHKGILISHLKIMINLISY